MLRWIVAVFQNCQQFNDPMLTLLTILSLRVPSKYIMLRVILFYYLFILLIYDRIGQEGQL